MSQQAIFNALRLLTPSEIVGVNRRRFGKLSDGGIVLFDDFWQTEKIYAFGMWNKITAAYELAELDKQVFLFDPNVDAPIWDHKNFNFRRLRLWTETVESQGLVSLGDVILELGHDDRKDLFLKLNLEGQEQEVLDGISSDLFRKFRQIFITFYNLNQLSNQEWRTRFVRILEKIRSAFAIGHVHANNYAPIVNIEGFCCPDVLEVTFVRSELYEVSTNRTIFPTSYDHPSQPGKPDHLLWFYPFLPTEPLIDSSLYHRSLRNANRISEDYNTRLLKESLDYHGAELERQLALIDVLKAST